MDPVEIANTIADFAASLQVLPPQYVRHIEFLANDVISYAVNPRELVELRNMLRELSEEAAEAAAFLEALQKQLAEAEVI